jgi:hypothetical protein
MATASPRCLSCTAARRPHAIEALSMASGTEAAQPHRKEPFPTVLGSRSIHAQSMPMITVGTPVTRLTTPAAPWSNCTATTETTAPSARPTAATLRSLSARRVWKAAGGTEPA